MNKLLSLSVLATTLLLSSCSNAPQEEPLAKVIDRGLKASTEQALLMAKELEQQDGRLPKSIKDGNLETSDCYWWCSGFFPGTMWLDYDLTGKDKWKNLAEKYSAAIDSVKYLKWHHDVGFMIGCSYLTGYCLCPTEAYKDVIVEAAKSLSTRFRPSAGVIQSWNTDRGWQAKRGWECPVIIDNMMNLELLFEATCLSGDSTFYNIAVSHADATMKNHFRADNSCYHVVDYSLEDGSVRNRQTAQGYLRIHCLLPLYS